MTMYVSHRLATLDGLATVLGDPDGEWVYQETPSYENYICGLSSAGRYWAAWSGVVIGVHADGFCVAGYDQAAVDTVLARLDTDFERVSARRQAVPA